MRNLLFTTVMLILIAGHVDAGSGKPDPTPNWRCRVSFRDAATDKIRSDEAGPYRDGQGGVTCYIVDEPGAVQHGWLFMSITGTKRAAPSRVVRYIGQEFEGALYPDFDNHGTFEVMGLGLVPWNANGPSPREVKPFRAYLRHPALPFADGLGTFLGDSNVGGMIGPDGTSSVFVQPIDACSWAVTSLTVEEPVLFAGERGTRTDIRVMRLNEGGRFPAEAVTRGDFPMPFQATVTAIANKPGCGLP